MANRFLLPLILALLALAAAPAQEYRRALPGFEFEFPRDHGAHPEFRTEWWYFTGNLDGPKGERFGYELTIFRNRLGPPGDPALPQSPMAAGECFVGHFAISDARSATHAHWERIGREGLGNASAARGTLDVRLHSWFVRMGEDGSLRLSAAEEDGAIDFALRPEKSLVVHGRDGVHAKAGRPGQASHYYSFTRLSTTGKLRIGEESFDVTGTSWMDHEFGSDALGDDEVGWDWMAVQFETGEDLMIYRIRRRDGSFDPNASGSYIAADGEREEIPGGDFQFTPTGAWKSPTTEIEYPMGWTVTADGGATELRVEPLFPGQEMTTERTTGTTYWEGAVTARGKLRGRETVGRGYVELVGYGSPFTQLGSRQGQVAGDQAQSVR